MRLTREQKYHLKGVAKELPVVFEAAHEKHLVKGSDILEWGTITEIDGLPIDPEREYVWHYPVQMYQNHYRRLKKAYIAHGMMGVYNYLRGINNIIHGSKQADAMRAFLELQKYINA